MAEVEFERARSAGAKQLRSEAILSAARDTAAERGVRGVTLTDVAAAVGMHKSALLRYFETREQIFLLLTAEGWREWSKALRAELVALPVTPGTIASDRARVRQAGALARTLATTLTDRPLFCDLLAHAPMNLERNVSPESLKAFKSTALDEAGAIAKDLRQHAPLSTQQARNVVSTSTGMAGALWQMAAPGDAVKAIYEADPSLRHAVVDVQPRLTQILTGLIVGFTVTA